MRPPFRAMCCSAALQVTEMTAEVGAALNWTFDNAGALGGCPKQVSLVGHSSGAHLCTMALLLRALSASKRAGGAAASTQQQPPPRAQLDSAAAAGGAATAPAAAEAAEAVEAAHGDGRMPARLVAVAGVYDLAKHYEYEEGEKGMRTSLLDLSFVWWTVGG